MASQLPFFTPIEFTGSPNTWSEHFLSHADNYFHVYKEKGCVIAGEGGYNRRVILIESPSIYTKLSLSIQNRTLRIALTLLALPAYIIFAIPIFAIKLVLRLSYRFSIINVQKLLEDDIKVKPSTVNKIQQIFNNESVLGFTSRQLLEKYNLQI